MMATEYKILSSHNSCHLLMQVQAYLDAGWKVQGGVSVTRWDFGSEFFQAIVREVERVSEPEERK